jgi:hypothetical protein
MSDEDLINLSFSAGSLMDDDVYGLLASQVDASDVNIVLPIMNNVSDTLTGVEESVFEYGSGFITESEIENIRDDFCMEFGSDDVVGELNMDQDNAGFCGIIYPENIYDMQNNYNNHVDNPFIIAYDPNLTDRQRIAQKMRIRALNNNILSGNVSIFSSLSMYCTLITFFNARLSTKIKGVQVNHIHQQT